MRSGFSQPRSFLHTATGACPGQLSPGHRALSFVCGQPTPGTNGAHLYLHAGKERSLSQHPAHLQQLLPVLLFFFLAGVGVGFRWGEMKGACLHVNVVWGCPRGKGVSAFWNRLLTTCSNAGSRSVALCSVFHPRLLGSQLQGLLAPAAGVTSCRCGAPAGPCLLGTRAWGAVITQPLGRSPAGEVMRGAPAPTANLSVQGALRSPPPMASLAGRSHGLLLLSRFQKVVHSEPDFLDHHGDLEWTLQFQNERRTARWGYPGGGGTPGLRPRICLLATGSGGK